MPGESGVTNDRCIRTLENLDAVTAQHAHRHVDMRSAGHGRPHVMNRGAGVEAGGRQQQSCHELAGARSVDDHFSAGNRTSTMDEEGKRACAGVVDLHAHIAHRFDQCCHRAPASSAITVEHHVALRESGDRRQKSHNRAGQADIDRSSVCGSEEVRNHLKGHVHAGICVENRNLHAQRPQGIDHQFCIS